MGSGSWDSWGSSAALVSSTTDSGRDVCSASIGSVSSSDVFRVVCRVDRRVEVFRARV
jgi:hypothetical protein